MSIPWILVLPYALFRMFEYDAVKTYSEVARRQKAAALLGRPTNGAVTFMGVVLVLARIAGWGILVWAAVKFGLLATVVMVVVAFVLAMVLSATLLRVLYRILGLRSGTIFLLAVPLMVLVILTILINT